MDFGIIRRDYGAATVVTPTGDLDVCTAPALRGHGLDLIDGAGRHKVIVDLSACTFIDSTGMGVLVGILKRVRAHDGRVAVTGCNAYVASALRVTGLNRLLNPAPTVSDALKTGFHEDVQAVCAKCHHVREDERRRA